MKVSNGLPVHEVTLYLGRFRRKGRAANTIHFVCCSLAILYNELDKIGIQPLKRFAEGRFLTYQELDRLASAAQLRVLDLDDYYDEYGTRNVININKIGLRHQNFDKTPLTVVVGTQASRLRYIADFLKFLAEYVAATLQSELKNVFEAEIRRGLRTFREHIPEESKRAQLNARTGLSIDEQDQLLRIVHPNSPENPWIREFVRKRNWLIIVLLLATGMRRGELLGLQIGDLHPNLPKLRIIRRADAIEDTRRIQPNTKTYDREIELTTDIMKALWDYINLDRSKIRAARSIPQVFVSDEGTALSQGSMDKIFAQLRAACPIPNIRLTSHIMRHTWNERFSEQADAMGLSETAEVKARNHQQGWSENSKMAANYTRRHTARKGREISLKLQERLDEKL